MPDFAPQTGVNPDGTPFTSYSRGIAPNAAYATILGTAGTAVTEAAGTMDTQNQFQIQQTVRADLEQANKAFGYTPDQVPTQVGDRTNIPPELGPGADKMSRMQQARAQGKLTDSQYWAQLTADVKDLRAQYPGYNDQIDSIVSNITGGTPANKLRDALDMYNLRASYAAKDTADRLDQELHTNGDIGISINPGYYKDPTSLTTPQKNELLASIYQQKSIDTQRKSEDLYLTNLKSKNELNVTLAKTTLGDRFTQAVNTTLSSAVLSAGGQDTMAASIAKLNSGDNNPQTYTDAVSAITQLELSARKSMQTQSDNPVFKDVSLPERNQLQEAALAPIEYMKKAIGVKDFGAAARMAATIDLQQKANMISLTQTNPWVLTAKSLSDTAGPNVALEWYNKNPQFLTNLNKTLVQNIVPSVIDGSHTPDEALGIIKSDDKLSAQDKGKVMTGAIQGMINIASDPRTPDATVATTAKQMFGQGKFDNLWASTMDSDKPKMFQLLFNPQMVDRISKLSDPTVKQTYLAWMGDKMTTIPNISQLAGRMGQSPGEYQYNSNTHQFTAIQGNPPPGMSYEDMQNRAETQNMLLKNINPIIATVSNTMTKLGVDPNDPNNPGSLVSKLNQMGLTGLADAVSKHADSTPGAVPIAPDESKEQFNFNVPEAKATFEQSAASGETKPILDLLSRGESRGSGYNASLGDGGTPRADITDMSLSEVQAFQNRIGGTGAVGRYQFIKSTLGNLIDRLHLDPSTPFTPALQDRLANVLLEDAGYSRFKAGRMTLEEFQDKIAGIWAGVQNHRGVGTYDGVGGNKASISSADVQGTLTSMR